nr:hypothetical protein B0A51_01195 [Rachicladosporium sp. CCFEE 5018]
MSGYDITNVNCYCPSDKYISPGMIYCFTCNSSQHHECMARFGNPVPVNVPRCYVCAPAKWPKLTYNIRKNWTDDIIDICKAHVAYLWSMQYSQPQGVLTQAVYDRSKQQTQSIGTVANISNPPRSFWLRCEAGLRAWSEVVTVDELWALFIALDACRKGSLGGPVVVDTLSPLAQQVMGRLGHGFVTSLGVLGKVLGLVPRGTAWDGHSWPVAG